MHRQWVALFRLIKFFVIIASPGDIFKSRNREFRLLTFWSMIERPGMGMDPGTIQVPIKISL